MDWDKLRIFHAVAHAGSFTHAGEDLNLSQSAVSRQISALEEDLGVQLFHRHARGLKPTEHGDLLYRAAHDVFDKLETVRTLLTDSRNRPAGDLRVTTTVGLGSTWLTPRIHEFLETYPDIRLAIICDDRELDLGMREADVAIRITEPRQPDLIKKRLFTVHTHLYASPAYLAKNGEPETIQDLDDCPLIAYGDHAPTTLRNVNWLRTIGVKPHARPRA
ncbi:MAG: LysR family transcriptional regulator, partial [Alphaproteobacteria bacterium]|nr:LysR family transcriptional regulator [Alphaproteobacteria bacterium]